MFFDRYKIDDPSYSNPQVLRHNLIAQIFEGSLFGFALSFISMYTVVPVFVRLLGGSAIAIAGVPIIWMMGVNMPQALLMRWLVVGNQMKPAVLRFGLLHRYSFFVLGIFSFLIPWMSHGVLSVALLLGFVALAAITGSMGLPPWFQLFTRTVPVKLRGRILAIRQLLSALLGIVGGSVVGIVIAWLPFPQNFGVLFLIAFSLMMISYAYLRTIQEPKGTHTHLLTNEKLRFFFQLRRMVTINRSLKHFLFVDSLLLISMSVGALYSVYALERFELPPSYSGTFTALLMASLVLGNIVFGSLADTYGHRLNLLIMAISSAAANIAAIVASNVILYAFVFFFLACTMSLMGISRMTFVAEHAKEEDRPVFVSIVNTFSAPVLALGFLGGYLVQYIGYQMVFVIAAACAAVGGTWLYRNVEEPRRVTG